METVLKVEVQVSGANSPNGLISVSVYGSISPKANNRGSNECLETGHFLHYKEIMLGVDYRDYSYNPKGFQ